MNREMRKVGITVGVANACEHKTLVRMAKQSKYISAFGNPMFSGPQVYEKGWIRVVRQIVAPKESNNPTMGIEIGGICGFTCFRHKVRQPETMLYFIMSYPGHEGRGFGQALMQDLESVTPHNRIALKVEKKNERAIAFYQKLGYVIEADDAYDGKGFLMAKENFK